MFLNNPATTSGCFSSFTAGFNASKCFYQSSGKTWWGAQADCIVRTSYTGGLLEVRNNNTRDFAQVMLTGVIFSLEVHVYCYK